MPPPGNLSGFDTAVAWFRARVPMDEADFADLSDALKAQAFHVAGVTQLELVTQVWEALDAAITDGTTLDDFKDAIQDKLTSAWGGEQPYRTEAVFRTWVQRSYAAGRYETMTSPVVKKLRPYWEFVAIDDSRTSDECSDANGTLLPVDDPYWATHNPPLHVNCRSTVISRTPDDALEQGLTQDPSDTPPQEGFGDPPDREFKKDLTGYPPALVASLKGREAEDDSDDQ